MTDKPIIEGTPETDEKEFIACVQDSVMRRLECKVVHSDYARSLERRLQEAQRQNREIIALMQRTDDRLEIALRESEELRQQNVTFRNAQKACEDCDAITMEEVRALRATLAEKGKP